MSWQEKEVQKMIENNDKGVNKSVINWYIPTLVNYLQNAYK